MNVYYFYIKEKHVFKVYKHTAWYTIKLSFTVTKKKRTIWGKGNIISRSRFCPISINMRLYDLTQSDFARFQFISREDLDYVLSYLIYWSVL